MDDLYYGFIFGAAIAIVVIAIVLYLKWVFIKTAVEAGTAEAMERMLKKYTDLSDYMKNPLHPESPEQREDKPQ